MIRRTLLLGVALLLAVPATSAGVVASCRGPEMHSKHDATRGHRYLCRAHLLRSVVVSKTGGLGQIEFRKKLGAVVQRDEGVVAVLDMSNPRRPKVVGRYDDDAQEPFDGDVAFSHDAKFVFYARQTHGFSKDGVHVLDVSDPTAPALSFYQASGGTLRIAYFFDGTTEWVVFLDAVDGLVVTRFVRESGSLVEVFRDPDPALRKVGGPASAGLFIDRKDPATGAPLLYVATGGSGLEVYDFSAPESPILLGSWSEDGLADVELRRTASRRTAYVASEYWFDETRRPEVVVLDVTDPTSIEPVRRLRAAVPADHLWWAQGLDWFRGTLLVAHSHAGLVGFSPRGRLTARALIGGPQNEGAEPPATEQMARRVAGYAMDVERRGRFAYLTDASTGTLHVLRLPR